VIFSGPFDDGPAAHVAAPPRRGGSGPLVRPRGDPAARRPARRPAGPPALTFSFDDLGVPPELRQADPFYDGDAFTVAANLAGGIGESDFGRDSRRIEGRVTLDKRPDPSNRRPSLDDSDYSDISLMHRV
jgi:hypothetical protein